MPWQVTALIYILFSSYRAIVNRRIGILKTDVSAYALAASFVAVAAVGIAFSLSNFSLIAADKAWELKHHFLLGGVLFAAVNIMQIKLYRFLPASVGVFLSLLIPVAVVISAGIFKQDTVTYNQMLGAVFITLSVTTTAVLSENNTRRNKKRTKLGKGLLVAVSIAVVAGPALTNESYLLEQTGLETYLLFGWGLQAIASFIIASIFWNGVSLRRLPANVHRLVWTYAGLLGTSGLFFVISIHSSGSVISVSLSSAARIALTLLMSYYLLKERDHLSIKLLGLVFSAIGLYFLFR